jgi:hypothetical protein
MKQSISAYIEERCSQWAKQTGESYRCPEHQQPNPFCNCVCSTGQRIKGKLIFDGLWEERSAEIQAARRRYHVWADQQRPEVKTRKQQFKQMIQNKQQEIQCFKAWQARWAAAGFQTVGHYQGR